MSRYLGPKHKLCRREGVRLCDSPKCPLTKRNYPPGIHGVKGRHRMTPYGMQFREKQKVKRIYQLNEKQFHNYFKKSIKTKGDTGEILLSKLETRLDNIIYRLGLATTRSQARQMVSHGFFLVNNQQVNIPSINLKTKDEIQIKKSKMKSKLFDDITKRLQKIEIPEWIHIDMPSLKAKIVNVPNIDNIKKSMDMKKIVEYYSR